MSDRNTRDPKSLTDSMGDRQLQRGLENRHLQLIAIGGAIGTGLFLGSGRTIAVAGPSILLVYCIIGFFLYFVMRAMGEILLSNFAYKSFADFATDLIGPGAGFYIGWTYWMCWVVIGVADTVAICGYLEAWIPQVPKWIPAACVVLLLTGLNMVAVKLFGELEFWFAMIKIATIITLIVIGTGLILVHFRPEMANAPAASLTHLWDRGGFFPNGILGFIGGFQIAVYSFQGVEMIGTAAAETADPQRNLPRAINSIPVRIIIFYVFALAVIMSVQPWDLIDPEKSPFVEMFGFVGIGIAFHIINFVVLTSAASSANSGIFSTSRIMYGMARSHNAPLWLGKLNHRHIPYRALIFTAICISPAIALVMLTGSVMNAFNLVAGISAVLYLSVWLLIVVCYLRYRTIYPERHGESVYKMPCGKTMSWVVILFLATVLVFLALDSESRKAIAAAPVWIIIMLVIYRALARTRAAAEHIDFNALREPARQAIAAQSEAKSVSDSRE